MQKIFSKSVRILLAGLILSLSSISIGARPARAEAVPASTPAGLNMSQVLRPGTFSNNSATISHSIYGSSQVDLNNGPDQIGAVWSTDDYKMDLTKPQKFTFWLNTAASEGAAFVLQNDPAQTAAISTYQGRPAGGESLGVWGADLNDDQKKPAGIAATAIQNSWALEFDAVANNVTGGKAPGKAKAFDKGIKTAHVAAGYPGQSATYKPLNDGLIFRDHYFAMNHLQLQPGTFGDGQWQHVALTWQPETNVMSLTLNERQPNGGTNPQPLRQDYHIDTSVFRGNGSDLLTWGLTGTTNDQPGGNAVIFEEVPQMISATAQTTLTNSSRQQPVNEGDQVISNNELELTHQLHYEQGLLPWAQVPLTLTLPAQTTFKSGLITYADGRQEDLSASEVQGQVLQHTLQQPLSPTVPQATITLHLQAGVVSELTEIPSVTSLFGSDAQQVTSDTPAYQLKPANQLDLISSPPAAIKLAQGEALPEQLAQLQYRTLTGSELPTSADQFTLHQTLNGTALPAQPLNALSADNQFAILQGLTPAQLSLGQNELTFYVTDQDGNRTSSQTLTLNLVTGQLAFTNLASTASFQPATTTGSSQLVRRQDDWQVQIQDGRKDHRQPWRLLATADKMVAANGRQLSGDLVFRRDGQLTNLSSANTVIAEATTTADNELTDLAQNQWQGDNGIFLQMNADAVPADYQGAVHWTLSDAP